MIFARGHRSSVSTRLSLSRVAFLFSLAITARAGVTLPTLLADHMVVQRGLPVHVWGMATPAEAVSVSFRGETRSATADDLGRWSLYLAPGEAGGPFQMTVKGLNTITLNDVLVGDVWVASGQSNMELPLTRATNAQAEIAAAQYPKIRILRVERRSSDYPLENAEAKPWAACTPETAADSSAVAYFFARNIQQKTGVPIGLLESFWGGTAAESWTSLRALSADASLMPVFAVRNRAVEDQATNLFRQQKEEIEFQQAVAQAQAEGKPAPMRRWHPDFKGWAPSALFNAMISPLTPFAIRGVIWYQGESNAGDRSALYAHLFQTMIQDWRRAWGQGDFPFLFVQLPNWTTAPDGMWPELREAQRQTLALRNTAMAITIDVGDPADLHPPDKQDVGLRLALAARAIVYGEKIEYYGPMNRQVTQEDHALRVWFDHAAGGLVAKPAVAKPADPKTPPAPVPETKTSELTGFEVAGSDRKFSPADAKIDGSTVIVSSAAVPAPVFVRYAWAANPECNLYNRDGLPASPFRAPE
jgi:sialate O-acetylesterase